MGVLTGLVAHGNLVLVSVGKNILPLQMFLHALSSRRSLKLDRLAARKKCRFCNVGLLLRQSDRLDILVAERKLLTLKPGMSLAFCPEESFGTS